MIVQAIKIFKLLLRCKMKLLLFWYLHIPLCKTQTTSLNDAAF